jgi:hypothetical protein
MGAQVHDLQVRPSGKSVVYINWLLYCKPTYSTSLISFVHPSNSLQFPLHLAVYHGT